MEMRKSKRMLSAELGMYIFIATEVMFFAALISAFLVFKARLGIWPPIDQPRLPLYSTAFNTIILLLSFGTIIKSAQSFAKEQIKSFFTYGSLTLGAGVFFILFQGWEWSRLISYGLATANNIYAATFYMLIGAHALHVLIGVLLLVWMIVAVSCKKVDPKDPVLVTVVKLYWIMVVFVWPVLYGLVYF